MFFFTTTQLARTACELCKVNKGPFSPTGHVVVRATGCSSVKSTWNGLDCEGDWAKVSVSTAAEPPQMNPCKARLKPTQRFFSLCVQELNKIGD